MCWKFVRTMSITNKLIITFLCATLLILTVITALVYPPMRALLLYAKTHHEHYHYILTEFCIKKLFIGLWVSSLILISVCYWLAKRSLQPLTNFSQELTSINALSLEKRIQDQGYPQELQQLAITCNEMLARIENSFVQMKQFSAGMAHELRNPLHYLQTATEVTLAKPQSVETYQQVLESHLEEYQHLTQLIDKLLFLTRSEQGQLKLHCVNVSAKQLINEVIECYQASANEKNISLQISGDEQIMVDEQLFKQVIANLLDNSLTYSNPYGTVSIVIRTGVDHKVRICITDTGIGIEQQHIPMLTQGFYRADYSNHSTNAGLGLGLSIAKSIMEKHQGQLEIQSQPGVGTQVRLTLGCVVTQTTVNSVNKKLNPKNS